MSASLSFAFPVSDQEQLVTIRRHGREMSGHHLPAICSLNEHDSNSEFGSVRNFWYPAPSYNCGVAENAHLNILAANGKTMTSGTFSGYDICFGKSSSHWSCAQKIIGNDPVPGR